jgi:hypothetical protein
MYVRVLGEITRFVRVSKMKSGPELIDNHGCSDGRTVVYILFGGFLEAQGYSNRVSWGARASRKIHPL